MDTSQILTIIVTVIVTLTVTYVWQKGLLCSIDAKRFVEHVAGGKRPPGRASERFHTWRIQGSYRGENESGDDILKALEKAVRAEAVQKAVVEDGTGFYATITFPGSSVAVLPTLSEAYSCDSHFLGVTPLTSGRVHGGSFDIIAVPGLASHPLGSFKSPKGYHVWLRDFLSDLFPDARVLLYGYDTKLTSKEGKWSIRDLARGLLEAVIAFRERTKTTQRPFVLVGHSLGGIIAKEALVIASKHREESYRDFFNSACGVMLFGAPNLGLRQDRLLSLVEGQPNEQLIRDLVVDNESQPSPYFQELNEKFKQCTPQGGNIQVVCFYEQRLSKVVKFNAEGALYHSGELALMVPEDSATSGGFYPGVPLDTDHSGLVKYASVHDQVFKIVMEKFGAMILHARRNTTGRKESGLDVVQDNESTDEEFAHDGGSSRRASAWYGGRNNVRTGVLLQGNQRAGRDMTFGYSKP